MEGIVVLKPHKRYNITCVFVHMYIHTCTNLTLLFFLFSWRRLLKTRRRVGGTAGSARLEDELRRVRQAKLAGGPRQAAPIRKEFEALL